ncbi:hypothetical protein KP509_17G016700 [Ceratopteris richardii]|nr:hypothetical protein KP509_17G016700 [Ceratopteris richardii]
MVRFPGSSRKSAPPFLVDSSEDESERNLESYPLVGLYDRPLPCCGCGVGWFSVILGFFFPPAWFYGTILYLASYYERDPRERSGLATAAIMALICTLVIVIVLFVIFLS